MPRNKILKLCSVEGCWKQVDSKGFCTNHYAQFWRTGSTEKIYKGNKRNHHLYHLWFERKSFNLLCEEWLDFYVFIKSIEPKPEGNYFLVRLDGNRLFGPDNFKWQEHLKRKEGENRKDWWARKRQARILANPSLESDRNIKRIFGLSREDYNKILESQNYVCAICEKPETSVDGKTGTVKKLAVDHCHNSLKIRGLLCWRCNATLGKVKDNKELLYRMIKYLDKYNGD